MFSKIKNEVVSLKGNKKIEDLFNSSSSFNASFLKLFCYKEKSGFLEVGFGVSKSRFPKAVDRNNIKRKMREQFKKIRNEDSYEVFFGTGFFIYTGKKNPDFSSLEIPMKKLLTFWRSLNSNT